MKRILKIAFLVSMLFWPVGSLAYSAPQKPILYESGSPVLLAAQGPKEQRDERYIKLLEMSLKIHAGNSSGSGTICDYDEISGFAYVISCGHLWSGNMDYKEEYERPKAKVISWYKGKGKLTTPESFEAEVLFWSNERGYDVSLLRFKPNWCPEFAPIDKKMVIAPMTILNSMGCDGGREVARYEVVFKEMRYPDIITAMNSPRPGRSGGGLLTDNGRLVGVCWGTSDISSGEGIGYFTPVSSIEKVFERNGHGWLLRDRGFRTIPIVDRENSSNIYDSDFVPIPSKL
jgi:hypothetical protein